MDVYIATGYYKNVIRSVIEGVPFDQIESITEYIPQDSIDTYNRVHLWGVPDSSQSIRYWLKAKQGDILIIRPFPRNRGKYLHSENVYVSIIVGKYPLSNSLDEIERAKRLSKMIWVRYRNLDIFPYILFIRGNIVSITLEELANILGLSKNAFLGYRLSLMRINPRKINKENIEKLINKILTIPESLKLYELLEDAYLELSSKYSWDFPGAPYGIPVHAGGRHIWGQEGLFEKLNERLVKLGYRRLTWTEYRDLLRRLQEPEYYGKIYITFHVAPNGNIEPHDIIIYKPVFKRKVS